MGIEENKLLVRGFYQEVVNTGNVERVHEFVAPDYAIEMDDGGQIIVGVEGAVEHIVAVRQTYPDLTLEILDQIGEGDWVVTKIIARGTHAGEWMGMKPTGKRLEFSGVDIDKVVDGKIVLHGGAANMLLPLMEAGAVKPVS